MGGARALAVEAPPPGWCAPFLRALPTLASLDAAHEPIALESAAGQALLADCAPADRAAHDLLWPQYAPQQGRTLCGAASIATVLRAAAAAAAAAAVEGGDDAGAAAGGAVALSRVCAGVGTVTEEHVLEAQDAVAAHDVRRRGVTLDELAAMLRSLGAACACTYARADGTAGGPCASAAAEADAMRDGLAALHVALRGAPARSVLVNYHMSTAGQRPFRGHVSPLGAYHAPSGRFLVLDVWPETRPAWLSGDCLWAAMAATDADSGRSRGWLSVSH